MEELLACGGVARYREIYLLAYRRAELGEVGVRAHGGPSICSPTVDD